MIHIMTRKQGLIWLAATVNDNGEITQAWAFRKWYAEQKVINLVMAK